MELSFVVKDAWDTTNHKMVVTATLTSKEDNTLTNSTDVVITPNDVVDMDS